MKSPFSILTLSTLLLVSCQSKSDTGLATSDHIQQALVQIANDFESKTVTLDEQDRKILEKLSPLTINRIDEGHALTVYDIIKLSQSGISDQTIIKYMKETHAKYELNQEQIKRLQNAGVSPKVISFIMETGR